MKKIEFKTLITIILVVMLFILAFILFIGYVFSNINLKNKLEGYTIAISFIGIFATFGGAYLGAKISANTAIRLSRQDKNIESSTKTLSILSEIDRLSKNLIEKIKDNKIALKILEQSSGQTKNDLKEYKAEYIEWQKCYSEISIRILGTNLNKKDIQCLKEPTYLIPYMGDYINRFTYFKKNDEGVSKIKVYTEMLHEYVEELSFFQKKLGEIEKEIAVINEKIIEQFPK